MADCKTLRHHLAFAALGSPFRGDYVADHPSDNAGHRARLRARLFEGGGGALLDHELVKYLLALAIPRRDTKAQAKALIARFAGIGPPAGHRFRNAPP
jgi:hypothetical protein